MIWLVWHRYRFLFGLMTVVLVALAGWMLLAGHALTTAESSFACRHDTIGCHILSGVFSLSNQATAINFLLLFVPCLLGIVFGAPLVAGEIEHFTNRLLWTQGISRTRWLLVKWGAIALVLVALVALMSLVSQWWTGHAIERISANLSGLDGGRLQPTYFPITGLALSAYTLFAFALGTALGALFRKTSWAAVGTVVLYTAVSLLLLLVVRPSPRRSSSSQLRSLDNSTRRSTGRWRTNRGTWASATASAQVLQRRARQPRRSPSAARISTTTKGRTSVLGEVRGAGRDLLPTRWPLLGAAMA